MSIQDILKTVSAWAWPAKFLFGAVVTSLAGGGVLTFLLQNAAYSFALTYGFRPPVEGVPYLAPMVTFASVALLILGALLSTVFIFGVRITGSEFFAWINRRNPALLEGWNPHASIQAARPLVAIPLIVAFSAAFTGIEMWLLPTSWKETDICAWPLLLCSPDGGVGTFSAMLSFGIGLIILTVIWRPPLVWVGTLLFVSTYYAWIGLSVLPADGYGRLLRTTGFGGGLPIRLDMSESDLASTSRTAFLLMRTSTSLIVLDSETRSIDEYALERIVRIRHATGGLHTLPPEVPKQVNLMQR